MPATQCPSCATPVPDHASACPQCGKPLPRPVDAPIHHLGGKLQVIGTLLLAGAFIATVAGFWWGPALLFPGSVVFLLGRFW
ncbi:zinc ribbon domain-containing protein [Candidatus Methylocalor cossyra]|uniref:Zinc-ribbon domain protein n=1 Tax=Candidatus Methylocalor cossyra TaxID=3108543 RepID=A0ABM9NJM8_9GAMM